MSAASCNVDPSPSQLSPLRIIETVPAASDGGTATHPAGPALSITFNRRLAPSTVHGGNLLVRSGAVGVFTGLRYDVVRRRVDLVPDARSFRRTIAYDLVVTADVRAWDGASLERPLELRFLIGPNAPATAWPAPSLSRDVAPLLASRCATAGCHAGTNAVMGLDLSSPSAIVRTTLRVPSIERPAAGATARSPSDPRWGAMLRVDPGTSAGQGRPEYSYLVYKILGDGPVIGARMPPDGPALTDDECALVADWIALGAPSN